MKSTELSAALHIEACRRFRDNVRELEPWKAPTYILRAFGYRDAWQYSVSQAAHDLAISTRDPVFRELYGRRAPMETLEVEVVDVGSAKAPAPTHANGVQ